MAGAHLAYVNLFARDIEVLMRFYAGLFGFAEMTAFRSPIYRCLDAGGIELGFNAAEAYRLLDLDSRRPAGDATDMPVGCYFTVELESTAAVDQAAIECRRLGGGVIKLPYRTYYNAWQTVLTDPEGNVFRANHRIGPRKPFADLPADQRPL